MRDVVCIYTGQGAAGNFKKIAIYTGQFSSCSPVVMFNEKTFKGGLYHLPGKRGDATKLKNDEWHNLEALVHMVEPTKIILFPCGDYGLRQSFVEGSHKDPSISFTDDEYDAADEDMNVAKTMAFDRINKGDQRELGKMFAHAKGVQTIGYNVELETQSYTGIQVTSDDNGLLCTARAINGSGGAIYDLKRGNFPPENLCAILNPNINYGLWYGAT